MKVTHICSYYLGTRLYQKLFEELDRQSVNNFVYVPTVKNPKTIFNSEEIPINVLVSHCLNKYDRIIFHYKHLKIYHNILKNADLNKIDICHAHSLFSNGYIAYKIKQRFKIPYITAVRNTDINTFFKYMFHLRTLGIKILLNSEKIIFLSESYKEFLLEKYIPKKYIEEINQKSVIIPNGIDGYWLNNKQVRTCSPKNKKINLIYIGTIDKNKNLTVAVETCKILISEGYDVKYTVAGKIIDKKIYDKIIKEVFVIYIPHQPKEKLMEIYKENNIFLMPSITETFGLVYAEAMSQGLPVIYTRGQGFDKQFDDGIVGYSVDCFNPHEIAEKIIKIIDNYNNISLSCNELCNKFDWNTIAKKYVQLYNGLVK